MAPPLLCRTAGVIGSLHASGSLGSHTVTRRLGAFGILIFSIVTAVPCRAYDVLLRWTVPPQADISGYRIYSGAAPQTYHSPLDTGLLPTATVNGVVSYLYRNLQLGTPYYVAVTAYNTAAMESDYSNEKVWNLSTVTPPSVNAGPDLVGGVGQLFTLGSAPQLGVSYYWEQTAGTPVSLSSRTASHGQQHAIQRCSAGHVPVRTHRIRHAGRGCTGRRECGRNATCDVDANSECHLDADAQFHCHTNCNAVSYPVPHTAPTAHLHDDPAQRPRRAHAAEPEGWLQRRLAMSAQRRRRRLVCVQSEHDSDRFEERYLCPRRHGRPRWVGDLRDGPHP